MLEIQLESRIAKFDKIEWNWKTGLKKTIGKYDGKEKDVM